MRLEVETVIFGCSMPFLEEYSFAMYSEVGVPALAPKLYHAEGLTGVSLQYTVQYTPYSIHYGSGGQGLGVGN